MRPIDDILKKNTEAFKLLSRDDLAFIVAGLYTLNAAMLNTDMYPPKVAKSIRGILEKTLMFVKRANQRRH